LKVGRKHGEMKIIWERKEFEEGAGKKMIKWLKGEKFKGGRILQYRV